MSKPFPFTIESVGLPDEGRAEAVLGLLGFGTDATNASRLLSPVEQGPQRCEHRRPAKRNRQARKDAAA